jgi:hypothetical protein
MKNLATEDTESAVSMDDFSAFPESSVASDPDKKLR